MVELYWPRDTTFMDNRADLRFTGSGVYEVPDRLEEFYRSRGWEDPPEDHDEDAEEPDSANTPNLSGPTRDELVEGEGDEDDDGGGSGN
jgi:hypothetical protein